MDRLTPREQQVLRLMAEGRSNAGIVETLKVSPSAVEKYVTNIFIKLDLPPHHYRPPPRPGRPQIPRQLTPRCQAAGRLAPPCALSSTNSPFSHSSSARSGR